MAMTRDDDRRTPEPCMCGDYASARDEWIAIVPPRWRWSVVATLAHDRHADAASQYGDEWRSRDNLSECLDELADALNYVAYAHATGHIATDDATSLVYRLEQMVADLLAVQRATQHLVPDIEQAHAAALAEKEARARGDHS